VAGPAARALAWEDAHATERMKFELLLNSGRGDSTHHLEVEPLTELSLPQGRVKFLLGDQAGEADWAELERGKYSILIDGRAYLVRVLANRLEGSKAQAYNVSAGANKFLVAIRDPRRRRTSGSQADKHGPREILAPMPGKIVRLLISENQEVRQNQGLLVIEAMKMQNELKASRSGRVEEIYVAEGQGVETGAKLIRLS